MLSFLAIIQFIKGYNTDIQCTIVYEKRAIILDHYRDMHELIKNDRTARKYLLSLPDYIREQITSRAANVTSFDSLRNYAENLLRGDN